MGGVTWQIDTFWKCDAICQFYLFGEIDKLTDYKNNRQLINLAKNDRFSQNPSIFVKIFAKNDHFFVFLGKNVRIFVWQIDTF